MRHTSESNDKIPNSSQCSQTVLNGRHTSATTGKMPKECLVLRRSGSLGAYWWTYLVSELVSSSRCMFPFHRKSVHYNQCQAVEKQGGSPKEMVSAAARNIPPSPSLRAREPQAAAPHSHPGVSSWRLCSVKPFQEPDIVRAQQPHAGSQTL